jgi:ParB-like chromosome segregation protein Spo0J
MEKQLNAAIQSLPLERLLAHPANCNRMSEANFRKLLGHIKRTGRYEPLVVRPDPAKDGFWQILNGHHRREVLAKLGCVEADCIVWCVDDAEASLLVATLNRLTGRDDLTKRAELIEHLTAHFKPAELTKLLPEKSDQIRRLCELARCTSQDFAARLPQRQMTAQPQPLVFFLTDEQNIIVNRALQAASQRAGDGGPLSGAARKAAALTAVAKAFIAGTTSNQEVGGVNPTLPE